MPATQPAKSTARWAAAACRKSIAVFPFENLSRDPDNAYFTDGIPDEILTRFSTLTALKITLAHFNPKI